MNYNRTIILRPMSDLFKSNLEWVGQASFAFYMALHFAKGAMLKQCKAFLVEVDSMKSYPYVDPLNQTSEPSHILFG